MSYHVDPVTNKKTINFDPTSAMQVIQPDGTVGAQSPALGLFHELAHWWYGHEYGIPRSLAEYFATRDETNLALQLGEPIRETYYHASRLYSLVVVDDVTASANKGYWKKVTVDNQTIFGPEHDPTVIVIDTSPPPPPPQEGGAGGEESGGGSDGGGGGGGGGIVGGGGGSGTVIVIPQPPGPPKEDNQNSLPEASSNYVEIEIVGTNDFSLIL